MTTPQLPYNTDSYTDLEFSIYVLSGKTKGESIVFTLSYQKQIFYTGVVDCAKSNGKNHTIELLKYLNITNINCIFWTHPHFDHSFGLCKVLKNYTNKNSLIFLPEGIYGESVEETNYSKKDWKMINLVNNFVDDSNDCLRSVSASSDSNNKLITKEFIDSKQNKILFEIVGVSPNQSILRRLKKNGKLKGNDLSIGLLLQLGEYKVFLSGDMEDDAIQNLNKDLFKELNVLKIPHHGSNSSETMISVLEELELTKTLNCTTINRQPNLPDLKIIKKYKNVSNEGIFSTGNLDQKKDKFEYGIVSFTYNVGEHKLKYKFGGNAQEIGSKL